MPVGFSRSGTSKRGTTFCRLRLSVSDPCTAPFVSPGRRDLTWGTWSECTDEGKCAPLSTEEQECERCGTETRTCSNSCSWGDWGACLDQLDCEPWDSEDCETDCESTGTRTCSTGCSWGGCVAPTESCNGVDDDCDDSVDEGFRAEVVRTTFTNLDNYHLLCDGQNPRISLACNSAIL